MYEMKEKKRGKFGARDCAYIAAFTALTVAVQLALSVIPGVELVTVLFAAFAFAFGIKRGVVAAVVFSLLRQLVFGFFLNVLVLYLIYYPFLAVVFGLLGRIVKPSVRSLAPLTAVACVCTALFTLTDNILTPLVYGYTMSAIKVYFYASLSFMLPQLVCTAATVAVLFLPLTGIFLLTKKNPAQ